MNKISIIVPIYNCEKYLNQCIDSVVKQSYNNWELLLVDDGSSDTSIVICEAYEKADARIKVIRNKHIGLPGVTRNSGIKASTGSHIMFLDADDFLETEALEVLFSDFLNKHVDLAICNFRKIKDSVIEKRQDKVLENSCILCKEKIIQYGLLVLEQQNKNILFNFCWGKIYNASIIRSNRILFSETLYTFEDIDFNFRYLKHVYSLVYTSKILYNYIIHKDFNSSTFHTDYSRFYNYIESLFSIRNFFKGYIGEKTLSKKIGSTLISLTIIQLIRSSVLFSEENKEMVTTFYNELLNNPIVRSNLKYYRPKLGESILIPFFIFLKLRIPLMLAVKKKAIKRYGSK